MTMACAVWLWPGGDVAPASAAPAANAVEAVKQAERQVDMMLFRIHMFHQEARSGIRSALKLKMFQEYFTLEESKANRFDSLGQILLTPRQTELRQRMEAWVMSLQRRFPIGEACLVDRDGQEHLRVVHGEAEQPVNFSHEEQDAPFFDAAFAMAPDGVLMTEPYMSPDSLQWVSAFVAPVILPEGSRPAFFHYEVPLGVYQTIVSTHDYSFAAPQAKTPDHDEEGRYFILDARGLVVADNRHPVDFHLKAERHPDKNPELGDFAPAEKWEDYLRAASSITAAPAFLEAVEAMKKGERGMRQLTLEGKPYILLFRPLEGRPWSLGHLDPVAEPGFWEQPAGRSH
ncbi:MAG: cache domain-containing protein [Magnetococcales bacterium]|nr:cache domain-containing protein [Magnetococcales bacterium]